MDSGRTLRDPRPTSGWWEKGHGQNDFGCAAWSGVVWEPRTELGPLRVGAHSAGSLSSVKVPMLFSRTQALPPSTCCLGDLSHQGEGKILIFSWILEESIKLEV